jgi:hypothetical protein
MSNRGSSRQHGCHKIKQRQPRKSVRKQKNKACCRPRQQERQEEIQKLLTR